MSQTDPIAEVRQHIEKALLAKATADAAFRELLKTNPHAAIKEMIGTDPVPNLKMTVIEETAGELILVLPRSIAQDELPDELLDLASGGAPEITWTMIYGPNNFFSSGNACPPRRT
ncbi:NHLP leader peptide family natural product precursor [Pannonibacter sp. P2PFMT1]|uniref:NHLP leader peptide family natural product precursor n=1 Tax=Pannonibacter sp. P2PFMT1 TaxID=2003582 RepID=UPI001645F74F|nr:NHLP leader peptide family natural product precursor [Pannonibacter sp. P2PFMT1]